MPSITHRLITTACSPTAWLMTGQISRLVLAIISKDTRETLERWQFDVTMDGEEAGCVALSLMKLSPVRGLITLVGLTEQGSNATTG